LILLLGALFLNAPLLAQQKKAVVFESNWSLGGLSVNSDSGDFLTGYSSYTVEGEAPFSQFLILEGAAFAPGNPLTNVIPVRSGILKYKVQPGDTLSSVAASFGISVETIRFANPSLRSFLRAGEELVILPVSGILYETKDGDTIEFVANRYQISVDAVKQFNPDYQKLFSSPGNLVILPNAKPLSSPEYVNRYVRGLPDLSNYFALPARGWNWGQLHDYNAVDIADQCGRPIYAAAEGLVIEESSGGFWNRGYGNYILIEHPNGTRTRYAHTARNLVRVGDYVAQGDEIALIGNTGNTHGPTGCHLHFEVYGARNPFALR
jgi:murein DD-endopeptidase MepM/ murein hydrolase activator NlpD